MIGNCYPIAGDASKVRFLKSLPYADTRLVLFQAEIYNPDDFDHAIIGCETVLHLVTPKRHIENSQFKNITDAALAAVKSAATSSIQSGTVKRLIYTSSLSAAYPVKIDGCGFKDFVDETCWTPPNLSFPFPDDNYKDHVNSKTSVEKEILSYDGKLDVVTLTCGLPGGETILNHAPGNMWVCISQFTDRKEAYNALKFVEDFLGIIPVVHVDDACEAHIFCMENPSISGRFFCPSGYVSTADIANYFQKNYP
ncbi:hypothetical protein SLEP1_g2294 [Rubroshorea leprosula]|uniref:NAD-dependent epimerase/dehydratase domain-containing protein n=1 Tax=Rubroshorea leprosula TaxID=152421 RepID=A0AAV5HN76_9ROSI|nr:hypothetical protein SLEP1_g2294 [Rubroshorea leprosula]